MAQVPEVYVLGGYQTDFARNWSKEKKHFVAMMREAVVGALQETKIDPSEVEVAHTGNFAAELYSKQGHLGAFFCEIDPAFSGLPTSRHEAACASGSIAMLAASAEIEAHRYDLACVVGVVWYLWGFGLAVVSVATRREPLVDLFEAVHREAESQVPGHVIETGTEFLDAVDAGPGDWDEDD